MILNLYFYIIINLIGVIFFIFMNKVFFEMKEDVNFGEDFAE